MGSPRPGRRAAAALAARGAHRRRASRRGAGRGRGRAQFAATNWKKVWKNDLQQYADKRYYTKKKSDKKHGDRQP